MNFKGVADRSLAAKQLEGNVPEGLSLFPGFMSHRQQNILQRWVNTHIRFQPDKYGIMSFGTAKLPNVLKDIANQIYDLGIFGLPFDDEPLYVGSFNSVYIARYSAGQGIHHHRDKPIFGNSIAGLSLGSSCVMELIRQSTQEYVRMLLNPGDLYVLQGPARYQWEHGIPSVRMDDFGGRRYKRKQRESLTFRHF